MTAVITTMWLFIAHSTGNIAREMAKKGARCFACGQYFTPIIHNIVMVLTHTEQSVPGQALGRFGEELNTIIHHGRVNC